MCCRVIPMCRWVMPHVLVSEGGLVVLTRTCHSAAQIGHTFSVGASNRRRLFLPRVFQQPHHHWLWGRCRHTHRLEGWHYSPVVPLPRLRKAQSSETHFAQDQTKTRLLMRSEYWTFQNRPDSWGQEHWGLQSRSYRHDQFRNVLLAFLVKVTHQFFSTEDLETALKTHYFFLCLAAQKAVQETKYCSYWSIDVIDHGVSSHQHYKEARGTTSLGIGIYSLPRLRDLF